MVLSLEGNPTCNQFTVNAVSEVRVTTIIDNTYGPTTPPPGQRIEVNFEPSPARIQSWRLVAGRPLNFVIIKGQGASSGAKVYLYDEFGATEDENLPGPAGANIAAVSFCYGLPTSPPPPPPPPLVARRCDQTTLAARCDAAQGDKYVVFKVNTGNSNGQYTAEICQCNITGGLTQCDPDNPQAGNACIKNEVGGPSVLNQVNLVFEALNSGSYYCTTVGGKRTCYNIRQP